MKHIYTFSRLLSERVAYACREYLNCRYEPLMDDEIEKDEITIGKKADYFKELNAGKKYMLLITYLVLLVIFFRVTFVFKLRM